MGSRSTTRWSHNLRQAGRDNAACDAAISVGHSLGLEVIAEGVETEEQARLLRDLGCDSLQGFHFYSPLRSDELTSYLDQTGETQRNRIPTDE